MGVQCRPGFVRDLGTGSRFACPRSGDPIGTPPLARELKLKLKLRRKLLYAWRDRFRSGGAEGLRTRGRPRKVVGMSASDRGKKPVPSGAASDDLEKARRRIAELERKVG